MNQLPINDIVAFVKSVLISLILIFILSIEPPLAHAVYGLANLSDTLNSVALGAASTHSIRFTLPANSSPIRNIDYIQMYFASFTDLTAPTLVTGGFAGDPVFSLSGQYARITGIVVQPGQSITIEGITSTNPVADELFQVVVMVTEDEAGLIVKNYANVVATRNWAPVTISASIEAALANLQITGYTAPDTFIIFTEGNSVIGTEVANTNGYYNHVFSGLQPTTHYITFYGIDTQDRTTAPVNLEIYTPAYQQTTVSNQLLSPTIEIDASDYLQGTDIIASGSAMPGGDITLFTDSPIRSYYASASSQGDWTYTVDNTDEYILGDYRAYTIVQDNFGLQSLISNTRTLSIISDLSGGTACGDITQGDLNCDGDINLTDFSILMYYWATADSSADINNDSIVNLTDFSIMMYFWGT